MLFSPSKQSGSVSLPETLNLLRSPNFADQLNGTERFRTAWKAAVSKSGVDIQRNGISRTNRAVFSPLESFELLDNDRHRTRAFLDAVSRLPLRTQTVLDAGTGSTAILALAAAVREDVQRVTALELHPASVQIARELVNYFGLAHKITVVEADARKWKPENEKYDCIVSETVGPLSLREPVLQVMQQVRSSLAGNGILLPGALRFMYLQTHWERVDRHTSVSSYRYETELATCDMRSHEGRYVHGVIALPEESRAIRVPWGPFLNRNKFRQEIAMQMHMLLGDRWYTDSNEAGKLLRPCELQVHDDELIGTMHELYRRGEIMLRIYPGQNDNRVYFADLPVGLEYGVQFQTSCGGND